MSLAGRPVDTASLGRSGRTFWVGLSAALCAGMLLALHGFVLRYPFIADDYIFLFESRTGRLGDLFAGLNLVQNYYRPLGRELYFFGLSQVFGNDPLPFHLFNFGLLVAAVALVLALGWRLAGPRAGVLAGGTYALLYPHRVQMAWASCSQDLLATVLGLWAVWLYTKRRRIVAAAIFFAALFAKESVAPLPLVLALWEASRARPPISLRGRLSAGFRSSAPLWVAAFAWFVVVIVVRTVKQAWAPMSQTVPVADVALGVGHLWEGFRLALLSYFYLDQPLSYLRDAAAQTAWPWLALGLAAILTAVAYRLPRREAPSRGAEPSTSAAWLGILWATVGALPVALVGHHFSAYYVSFCGAGFALWAGWALAKAPWPLAALVFVAAGAADAVANRVESFRMTVEQRERPGVSYVSISRLAWEERYLEALQGALREDPPPQGGILYLSHTPQYLMLATAGDRAPRIWFHDPTLDLSFITQYHPGRSPRPRRFVRFDTRRWSFALLPDRLVDQIVSGEDALAERQPERARVALAKALALAKPAVYDVERGELENSYGLACYQTGDTAAARAAWYACLAIDDSNHGALLNLTALSAREGDFLEARRYVLRALADLPHDALALYYLARLEGALGHPEAEHEARERLAAADPGFLDSVSRGSQSPR